MLFIGKVVRVLRQVNPLSTTTRASPSGAWPHDSQSGKYSDPAGEGTGYGDAEGADFVGGVGVGEDEVLRLTQRWSDLRDREAFHLLALERAVHEVISCWLSLRLPGCREGFARGSVGRAATPRILLAACRTTFGWVKLHVNVTRRLSGGYHDFLYQQFRS